MKKVLFLFLFIAVAFLGYSQSDEAFEMSYEINKVFPAVSIKKDSLEEAIYLKDINRHFKKSWVRTYLSVEIETQQNGKSQKAIGECNALTDEQKTLLNNADLGSDILVSVNYMPENTMKHNDPKVFEFSFQVDPENDAEFPGGEKALTAYITNEIQSKINQETFNQYGMAIVKFQVNEAGQIINPQLFWDSKDAETDAILLKAICNMPTWKPAEHSNGLKVQQDFALIVGDKESCAINTVNIDPDKFK